MAQPAESKEQGPNSYVHSVETSSNKENRTVDVLTSRKFNAVLVLVSLAEQEGNAKQNSKEQVSRKTVRVTA